MCVGLSKDNKSGRDKKIKPEKILQQKSRWRIAVARGGNVDAGSAPSYSIKSFKSLRQQKRPNRSLTL
jgi:hypothetical protein